VGCSDGYLYVLERYQDTAHTERYIQIDKECRYADASGSYDLEEYQSFFCTVSSLAGGHRLDSDALRLVTGFRDKYLFNTEAGRLLIHEYYTIAPPLIATLQRLPNVSDYWAQVYKDLVKKTCSLIRQNRGHEAVTHYTTQIRQAQDLARGLARNVVDDHKGADCRIVLPANQNPCARENLGIGRSIRALHL
jgi:hypothetical protein